MAPLLASGIADSSALFAIGLAVATAVLGAIVVLVKLPNDKSNAAVTQAQGANEALSEALEAVERERDYWRQRYETTHKEKNDLRAELHRLHGGAQP